MSIINDALKRAQQRMKKSDPEAPQENNTVQELTRERQTHPPKKAPPTKKSSTHRKKKVWYQTVSVLVVLFFFITGILLATLFFLMRRSADADPTAEIRREYMPHKKSRKFKPGELVLSGTSFVEDKKAALINGGIYEVGDIVEGYRITSIEIKEVQLKNLRGDNPIVLHVK